MKEIALEINFNLSLFRFGNNHSGTNYFHIAQISHTRIENWYWYGINCSGGYIITKDYL
jgi:hypothetical protein